MGWWFASFAFSLLAIQGISQAGASQLGTEPGSMGIEEAAIDGASEPPAEDAPPPPPGLEEALARFSEALEAAERARYGSTVGYRSQHRVRTGSWGLPRSSRRHSGNHTITQRIRGPGQWPGVWELDRRKLRELVIWDGHVDSFRPIAPDSLLNPEEFVLGRVEERDLDGRHLWTLVFETPRHRALRARVELAVEPGSFSPVELHHQLLESFRMTGVTLQEYELRLRFVPEEGLWLIAEGEESYRYTGFPGGPQRLARTWELEFQRVEPGGG